MRIFIGIDLDPEIRASIARFLDGVRGFAPEVRWVHPESLHLTLKFIGEQKPDRVEAIQERLRGVEGAAVEIRFAGYGFFPTAKAPRVFWIGIQAGPSSQNWLPTLTPQSPSWAFRAKTGRSVLI
jgi:2'-5' RNA ligase